MNSLTIYKIKIIDEMQKKTIKCKKNLVGIIFLLIFAKHKQQHK